MADYKHSSRRAEVVSITLEKHPDADKLSVVRIDDFVCVTNTEQWSGRELKAVYIQPDTVADARRPEFDFLLPQAKSDMKARIRAKKIRGVNSFGLLIPAPGGAAVGDDLWESLGLEHYEPPVVGNPSDLTVKAKGEKLLIQSKPLTVPDSLSHVSKYDLESGMKYARRLMVPGEECIVTEKIHGQNGRYAFVDGIQYAGSRTGWKNRKVDFSHIDKDWLVENGFEPDKADEVLSQLREKESRNTKLSWWQAFEAQPEIGKFCEMYPGFILFGEVYGGKIQGGFNYGSETPRFVAFDIMSPDGKFLPPVEARGRATDCGVPWVPVIWKGPFVEVDDIKEMAEGNTTMPANHIREGVVLEPVSPRWDELVGRVKFKFVGAGFLGKN